MRVHGEAADRRGLDQRRLLRASSPEVLRLHRGRRRRSLGARTARAPRRATASSWPIGTTASGSAWTRCGTSACWSPVGAGKAPWKIWLSSGVLARSSDVRDRRDRPGRRLAGAAACAAGADVVCLVRDWVPQSELVPCAARRRRQRRDAATSATRRCSSARSASTRPTRSSTWRRRRSSASPTAIRSRPSRSNIRGTWTLLEACRRSPRGAARSSWRRRQGVRRPARRCPTPRTTPLQGRHPYDVSKSCADLIAQTLRR